MKERKRERESEKVQLTTVQGHMSSFLAVKELRDSTLSNNASLNLSPMYL